MIWLTQQERDKFAMWLHQEADSNALLVEQLSKNSMAGAVVKMKRLEILACKTVAEILTSTETMAVGP